MTPTKLPASALVPGPEMDALVAEHVLGCQVKWSSHGEHKWPYCACSQHKPHNNPDELRDYELYDYSTSDAAALEVLKVFLANNTARREPYYHVEIDNFGCGWNCSITEMNHPRDSKEYRGYGDSGTLAEAICRAALEAKGVIA